MSELQIDDATIAAAERLFGIEYTPQERAQMRDNLAPQVEWALRRRRVDLPNALPPAHLSAWIAGHQLSSARLAA